MKKRAFSFLVLVCIAMFSSLAWAQNFSDAEIKAAYIYKLSKFVTWKGQHLNHITFCYIESSGQDSDSSVGNSFARLVKAKNAGGDWSIRKLHGASDADNCNMLFVADTEESSLPGILARIRGLDILTMSDSGRFIYKDCMLGFVLDDDNHVKMEANLNNIRTTNVMISATVLELMQQVVK